MNIGRSLLLLALIPYLAACGAADANAPCTDLNVREAALISLGARMMANAAGDNTWEAHIRDDRYIVPVPRQYRRALGMDSIVFYYSFDGNNSLVVTWPPETGLPDVHYSITDVQKLARSAADGVASCEGNLVIRSPGEFIRTEEIAYHVELLDDGHQSVVGQTGDVMFRSIPPTNGQASNEHAEPAHGSQPAPPSASEPTRVAPAPADESMDPMFAPAPPATPAPAPLIETPRLPGAAEPTGSTEDGR
jgi:hypothetical protein